MNAENVKKETTDKVATIEEVKIEPLADADLEKVVGGIKVGGSGFNCPDGPCALAND